ncbi:MAG: FISUMP domain-containing protein, partial [Prolixibacteraceae bacterium]|nr:FISUMP domain-containing protein [Prolixibacteraceae bacterium]
MSIATQSGTATPLKSGQAYTIAGIDTEKGDNVKVMVFKGGYVAIPVELTIDGDETLVFPLEAQTPPEVQTLEASDIESNSATLNGNVVSDGNATISERGFYWSATNSTPGPADNKETVTGTTGTFNKTISGLQPNTTYYVRAYATNSQGTAYGNQVSFTTLEESGSIEYGSFTDSRDNHKYKTVEIGNQIWMAENLAYLPSVSQVSTASETEKHYYVYDYYGSSVTEAKTSQNYLTFGVLYNWPAAMAESGSNNLNPSSVQGVCPSGWHLPSEMEWYQLADYLILNGYNYDGTTTENRIAKSLADINYWNTSSEPGSIGNDKSINNMSGFSARPSGVFLVDDQIFYGINEIAAWWSCTDYRTATAWSFYLVSNDQSIGEDPFEKSMGLNVRCIEGNPSELPDLTISTQFYGDFQASTSKSIQVTISKSNGNLSNSGHVKVHLYLSKTSTIGSDKVLLWANPVEDSDQMHTPDFTTSDLNSSGSKTVTATIYIPTNTIQGNYYLIAVVDEANYHPEINENNNTQSNPIKVTAQLSNQTGTFTDSRDNKTYKTVKIGDQIWMAENLAYLPSVNPSSQKSTITPYYYVFDYQSTDVNEAKQHANYATYGVLYNWPAAMAGDESSSANPSNVQGVCPTGWNLPSDSEWAQLENFLIVNGYNYDGTKTGNKIAKSMADTSLWISNTDEGTPGNYLAANNRSGFSALPISFQYYDKGKIGEWWSSTESYGSSAVIRSLCNSDAYVYNRNSYQGNGTSVRCVRGESQQNVITTAITSITQITATIGGNVTSDGGATITARGVCWNTTGNPTTTDNKTSNGNGTGIWVSELTGLQPGITYYVRAYATNSQGTAYGETVQFTTSNTESSDNGGKDTQTAVVDVTNPVTSKTWMDRNLGANHVATSSTDEDAYGDLYQWGRATDGHQKRNSPTTSSLSTSDTPGHGNFITIISGTGDWRNPQNNNLWQGVNGINNPCPSGYRLPTAVEWDAERKSWGSNNATGAFASPLKLPMAGIRFHHDGSLGSVGSFGVYWSSTAGVRLAFTSEKLSMSGIVHAFGYSVRCLKESGSIVYGELTDSRDNQKYKTVEIGKQTWMAENLAYLPSVSPSSTVDDNDPYYYVYDYQGTSVSEAKETNNYSTYGVLYNWPSATDVCPSGWHLPTDDEWKHLEMYIGMSQSEADNIAWRGTNEGTKLKATSGWVSNGNGTDDFGFSALPGGGNDGSFYLVGDLGLWWSSTVKYPTHAWYRNMRYDDESVARSYYGSRSDGASVRCVRNYEGEVTIPTVVTNEISAITQTTATGGGNVTYDGGATVTARGVCWGINPNPTTSNSKTTNGTGTGSFTSSLVGLTANTPYYVRAYATNSEGTAYGEQIEFRTLEEESGEWPRDTETAVVDVTNPATGKTW